MPVHSLWEYRSSSSVGEVLPELPSDPEHQYKLPAEQQPLFLTWLMQMLPSGPCEVLLGEDGSDGSRSQVPTLGVLRQQQSLRGWGCAREEGTRGTKLLPVRLYGWSLGSPMGISFLR